MTVQLGGITLNFSRVTVPGLTRVQPSDPCRIQIPTDPCRLPPGYTIFNNLAFDITTTATVSGPITVSFDLSRLAPTDPCQPSDPCRSARISTLRVFHGENGVFVDRTIPPSPITPPSPIVPTVFANVSSLSPFVIAEQPPQAALQSTLADLRALRLTVTNRRDAQRLDLAIQSLVAALDPRLWRDPSHLQPQTGLLAYVATGSAVLQLHAILLDPQSSLPAATVRYYIAHITNVDRRLALIAINDARAAGGNPQQIARATNELVEGDAFVAQSNFEQAIAEYAEAWGLASLAVRGG